MVKTCKILGSSSSVVRLLPSVRHLATQHDTTNDDNNTKFEKVHSQNYAFIPYIYMYERPFVLLPLASQENIFTVPNVLSLGRIVLSPALGYFVLCENYKLALAFFVLAGVSDMVGTEPTHE